ncbi:hypothetical protein BpHYR1_007626 [Brachionus plicatilis]|uniref:Uncharacterized protein n=1 Tax=Brachionus plicatilis TaxID=10195 RepID=A0A3M7RCU3_BRAPC|nr:hypothetical protein BpHYR1_007626 [Brachionus plicatilis]
MLDSTLRFSRRFFEREEPTFVSRSSLIRPLLEVGTGISMSFLFLWKLNSFMEMKKLMSVSIILLSCYNMGFTPAGPRSCLKVTSLKSSPSQDFFFKSPTKNPSPGYKILNTEEEINGKSIALGNPRVLFEISQYSEIWQSFYTLWCVRIKNEIHA